jgi:hypothetical protein
MRAADGAARRVTGPYPLSYGQRALWFLHQLAPKSAAYNVASAARVRSPLDVAALRRACQALVDRHPMLRTTFLVVDGEPMQQVHEPIVAAFEQVDAGSWSQATLDARLRDLARGPFELEHGPLFRVVVFTCGPEEHVLAMAVHHSVTDFWSLALLMRDLRALYGAERGGVPASLPAQGVEYHDYVRWQRQLLEERGEALWMYWRDQLEGAPLALELPTDRPRPSVQT